MTTLYDCDPESVRAGERNARQLAQWAEQRARAVAESAASRALRSVGVCGAGTMGTGIAQAALRHGVSVWIHDAAAPPLAQAIARLNRPLEAVNRQTAAKGSVTSAPSVVACHGLEELAGCDLIIESVVENQEVKQQILCRLATRMHDDAVLASNTSTISIGRLAASLPVSASFCGLHFCHPASRRRVVEVVCAEATDSGTVGAATAQLLHMGKLPIVVRDTPGFLVNRLLFPYLNESLLLLCEGVALEQVDAAARAFGMEFGPFELFDEIGIDIAMWAGRTLWEAYPDRVPLTPVLPALVKRGRLGRKAGAGFYRYETASGRRNLAPELQAILRPYVKEARDHDRDEILRRLLLPMLIEATRVMEEKVITDVRSVDVSVLYGLGFPAARGGLCFWADRVGTNTLMQWLAPLRTLGPRMQPTHLLRALHESQQRFYEPAEK